MNLSKKQAVERKRSHTPVDVVTDSIGLTGMPRGCSQTVAASTSEVVTEGINIAIAEGACEAVVEGSGEVAAEAAGGIFEFLSDLLGG